MWAGPMTPVTDEIKRANELTTYAKANEDCVPADPGIT